MTTAAHSNKACDLILFGTKGDLARRKLLPALYQLEMAGLLHSDSRITGVARDALTLDGYIEVVETNLQKFVKEPLDADVLAVERVSASLEVAAALDLRTGESVFHSVCVHLEDGVPIQLEDRFVNPQVVPDFAQQDFTQQQPSEFLVRTVPFDEIEHVVDAVLPTAEQAQRLQMDAAEPCLLLTRRTWTQGVPVTLVRCLHPASRYRLGSRYSANGNPSAT